MEDTKPVEDTQPKDEKFADVRSPQFVYTYLRRKNKKRKEEEEV